MNDTNVDLRVKVTRQLIEDSLLALLNEGIPLSKIGVTELSAKAGINRTTFYKHFDSVQSAFHSIEDNLCFFVLDSARQSKEPGKRRIIPPGLFEFIDKNEKVALMILSANEHGSFLDRVFEETERLYFEGLPSELVDKAEKLYSFIFGGAKEIVYQWLKNGKKESPKTIAKTIENFANGLLDGAKEGK